MNLNRQFCRGVPVRENSVRLSPTTTTVPSGTLDEAPISKTMQYKKITKPLLERKRRARINTYLDELKDIMTGCLQAEGENVSKLEKADILELTVRHLQKLSQAQRLVLNRSPVEDIARFRHGYSSCAQEAAQFLVSVPGVDIRVGQRLVSHLMGQPQPPTLQSCPPPSSPPPHSSEHPKTVPVKPAPIRISGNPAPLSSEPVWKPYSS